MSKLKKMPTCRKNSLSLHLLLSYLFIMPSLTYDLSLVTLELLQYQNIVKFESILKVHDASDEYSKMTYYLIQYIMVLQKITTICLLAV